MSAEENKKIVELFFDSSNRGDLETSVDLIADDLKWIEIGTTPFSGTFNGKDEFQENLLGPLFGQLKQGIRMEIHRLIAEGDYVVAQTSGTAETLDGRPYNNTYCWIMKLRDGKIVEVTEFMDTELVTSVFG